MGRSSRQRTPSAERAMRERGVYDPAEFDGWLRSKGWAWDRLERGDYGISLEEALVWFTMEDPVRWCETYLTENSGDPYRLFDYQRESMRAWDQDVVHEDGAEVGKTREITGLLLWAHITACGGRMVNPTSLIGAPQHIFLTEIIDAVERQVGVFKAMPGESFLKHAWLEPRRTPHTQLRFRCPNFKHPERPGLATVDFRSAGHDGEAFRGVHVTALAIVDEAAKMKTKLQWCEFNRAKMPGCRTRVYSVPDGDRGTEFYRYCSEAVIGLPPGMAGFRKFHWPKTVMPPPFWTPERDAQFVKLYGGRDTPGYVRNVLGGWGDAENPVFRWDTLLPNLVQLPDYRVLKLATDSERDALYCTATRIDLVVTEGRKSGQEHQIGDVTVDLYDFLHGDDATRRERFAELLAPFLSHLDARGVFWAGADLGERNDPTEIVISEEVGTELRDVLRVQAKGLPYHAQTELIFQIDRAFGHRPGWGVDLGSAGTAVVKDLQNIDRYASAHFDERLVGFHFQEMVDCLGEDGELLLDPVESEKQGRDVGLRAPAKHWATQCIVARLQQRGYRLTFDTDVLNDYTSHTARAGTKWPIYAKIRDHTIDARRMQMLAKLQALQETGGVDVFACNATQRNAA